MAISGNFSAVYQSTTKQPPAPLAFPDSRHKKVDEPKTAWDPIASPEGGGVPEELTVEVTYDPLSRGIVRTIGSLFRSHDASRKAKIARSSVFVDENTASYGNAAGIAQGAAQDASAMAHRDPSDRYVYPVQFSPTPRQGTGDVRSIDTSAGHGDAPLSTKAIARNGYSFVTTTGDGEAQVTGQRMPMGRNWVTQGYSSPALGGMYSTNALRGVRPQVINVPKVTPGIAGTRNSGIPGNQNWVSATFATPLMRRVPPSPSDVQLASQTQTTGYSDVETW